MKIDFGHFLDIGTSDRLDIAYYDRTKCCPTFGNTTRSRQIIRSSQKCIFEWSETAKMFFWPLSSVLFGGSTWYCLEWLDDKFTLNSVHNLANVSLKFRINRSLQLAWTYTQLSALRCVLFNLCVLCVLSALSPSACSAALRALCVLTDVEVARSRALQFSTSVEVRPGNVSPCVRVCVSVKSGEPL